MVFLKRLFIIFLLTPIYYTLCFGQGTKGTKNQLENALLWEIEVPSVPHKSYLFGTIHIIPEEDYFLPKGTLAAIDAAEKMVFEIDMGELSDMSIIMKLMSKIMMSDGVTLKDLLSEEDYELTKSHFQKMGLPLMFFERMKPMFLTVFAYNGMEPGALENGKIKSYELEFMKLAGDKSLPTAGLESIDFQISVFDSIPYDAQAQMLVDAIKNTNVDNDDLKKMVEMYKSQNINTMHKMINEDEAGLAVYEELLLVQRNKNWIPQIIAMSKEAPTFFAVGAGHLGGENGVINLLRKEGIKLNPITK